MRLFRWRSSPGKTRTQDENNLFLLRRKDHLLLSDVEDCQHIGIYIMRGQWPVHDAVTLIIEVIPIDFSGDTSPLNRCL